jgi:hypothetical protein
MNIMKTPSNSKNFCSTHSIELGSTEYIKKTNKIKYIIANSGQMRKYTSNNKKKNIN